MTHRYLLTITGLLLLVGSSTTNAAQAPVSLELATDNGFPMEGQQNWAEYLKGFGFSNIRIRSAQPDDEPKVVNRGTDASPRYYVTGILTERNTLLLPGATFRYGQRKQLTAWLEKLQSGGPEMLTAETGLFGLTAKQLVTLHDGLKAKVAITTKGKFVDETLRQLTNSLPVRVEIDAAAKAAIARNNEVLDELQGFSTGTALTVLVRPAGLVVTPTGQGTRGVGLRVTESSNAKETWPIGTAPKEPPDRLVPALFKFINVEINDRPLAEALDAIGQRIKIPILFDHNALARHEIDLQTKVSMPAKNTFYKKIIDELLFQALLRCELRVDEADQPFLWVTTVKR